MPASWKSHSNSTPVASSTLLVASASSGPVPSPGMEVTLYAKSVLSKSSTSGGAGILTTRGRSAPIKCGVWPRRLNPVGARIRRADRRRPELVLRPLPDHLAAVRLLRRPLPGPEHEGVRARGAECAPLLPVDHVARARPRG